MFAISLTESKGHAKHPHFKKEYLVTHPNYKNLYLRYCRFSQRGGSVHLFSHGEYKNQVIFK